MARKSCAVESSTTTHGGVITLVGNPNRPITAIGKVILKTDTIACPVTGHGTTTILVASTKAKHNSVGVVYQGCATSCGATISGTVDTTVQISE